MGIDMFTRFATTVSSRGESYLRMTSTWQYLSSTLKYMFEPSGLKLMLIGAMKSFELSGL